MNLLLIQDYAYHVMKIYSSVLFNVPNRQLIDDFHRYIIYKSGKIISSIVIYLLAKDDSKFTHNMLYSCRTHITTMPSKYTISSANIKAKRFNSTDLHHQQSSIRNTICIRQNILSCTIALY